MSRTAGSVSASLPGRWRAARVAVTAVFALNGFLAAIWVAHIPVISTRTGVSHDQLGGLLLLLGVAAFVGMQVCGPALDRWGSRPTTALAAVALSAALLAPISATDAGTLAVAVSAFGVANGALDVSMNAQAVAVERGYGRPVMATFHGFFSAGGLLGSGVSAVGLWLGADPFWTVAASALCGVVVVAAVAGTLLGHREEATAGRLTSSRPDPDSAQRSGGWRSGIDLRRLALLAALAFALMLAEGTAYDWSSLHVVETYRTSDALGAVAFGSFCAVTTLARFGVDPVVARVGATTVLRGGALIGVAGMALVVSAPAAVWAIVGWAIFGVGLAGLIPQIFTAAGNLSASSKGRTMSLVVGCGYLGMLAGPGIVGFVSDRSSISLGLVVAIVALAFAIGAAGVVRGGPPGDGDVPSGHATLEG